MSRGGALVMFLFIVNAVLILFAAVGISTGAVVPFIAEVTAQALTATTQWNTTDISGMGILLGYFVAAGYMLVTAIIFLLAIVAQMTVGAPTFYGTLFTIVIGGGIATTAFTGFFTLIQNAVIIMYMYEQYTGKDTGT